MRKQRDTLVKSIGDLQKSIEKVDPLSCDLDSFIKKEAELSQQTNGLKDKVEDGHITLKKINRDLQDLLLKLLGEKKQ